MHGHNQFLKGGIPSPLADAVDGALELAGTVLHRLKEVRHRQAQIVMAMNGEHRIADVGNMAIDAGDQLTEFTGRGVADGVWNVDRGGAGSDGRFDHRVKEHWIAATSILTGEFNVIDQ